MKLIGKFFFLCFLSIACITSPVFKLGLENIPESLIQSLCPKGKKGCCIALITNQTGVDQKGTRNVEVLQKLGIRIHAIYAPEHGFWGTVGAEQKVDASMYNGIPICSLYAGNSKNVAIDDACLNMVDAIFFDMHDSGMRHYTYISTLLRVMEQLQKQQKKLIVLDRPNPLGGKMDGPLVDPEILALRSFIAVAPIPVRHGLTIGEIAQYFNRYVLDQPIELQVVPMQDYTRKYQKTLHAPLSPNLTSIAACHGYSFLGLLGEIAPFDVGVGTDLAFQALALPQTVKIADSLWANFRTLLKAHGIDSAWCRYINRRGITCTGVKISIPDIALVSSFSLFLDTIDYFKQAGLELSSSPFFDRAVGTRLVCQWMKGDISRDQLMYVCKNQSREFQCLIASLLLYAPFTGLASTNS